MKRWPMFQYYVSLLRPGVFASSVHRVETFLTLSVMAGAVLAVAAVGVGLALPVWVPLVVFAFAVLYGLLRANYERLVEVERQRDELRKERDDALQEDMQRTIEEARRHIRSYALEQVAEAQKRGVSDIYSGLITDDGASESYWVGLVDKWDTDTLAMLKKHWTAAEVEEFQLDTGLVRSVTDWRERLQAHMHVKLTRLVTIAERALKAKD